MPGPTHGVEGSAVSRERRRGSHQGVAANLPTLILPLILVVAAAYIFLNFPWRHPQAPSSTASAFENLPASYPDIPASLSGPLPENSDTALIMSVNERTFIAVKPDGVQRGLVGNIIARFENRGFKLVALKLVKPSKQHLETHYEDLREKKFFPGLIQFMLSGPICAMIWEGLDVVKTGRVMLGATNPLASAPGTIRGDFAIDVSRNVCHGSDSVESAQKEIAHWFKDELVEYTAAQQDWIYEKRN